MKAIKTLAQAADAAITVAHSVVVKAAPSPGICGAQKWPW